MSKLPLPPKGTNITSYADDIVLTTSHPQDKKLRDITPKLHTSIPYRTGWNQESHLLEKHLRSTKEKLQKLNNILKKIAGSDWGCTKETLCDLQRYLSERPELRCSPLGFHN